MTTGKTLKGKIRLGVAALTTFVAVQGASAGLREDFASPQGAARVNTGPFLWMHQSDGEARLREYVRVIAESGQGVLTFESRPHDDWMGESWWRDVGVVIDECRKRKHAGGEAVPPNASKDRGGGIKTLSMAWAV